MLPPSLSVAIIIPAYNEEKVIVQSLRTLLEYLEITKFPYRFRIIVVDNASTDRTAALVADFAAAHPEVQLLKLVEKGKGRAVRAGWNRSENDILTFMDVDLSSDLASFQHLVEAVASGSADLAIGNRLGKNSKIVSDKNFRKFASKIYNLMARIFLRTGVDDHQCGFKAISRTAYSKLASELREDEFFFDTELIAIARKQDLSIHQEDIIWIDSLTSKVSLFSDSLKMFVSIIRLAWRLNVSRVQIRSATLINGSGGRDAIASEPLDRQVKVA